MSATAVAERASIPNGTVDLSGLPTDHPSRYRQRHQPQQVQEDQYRAVLREADVVQLFDALLRDHPGPQSRLSVEGAHVAMLAAAANHKSYKRSDITAAVRDLTDECAEAVGIDDRHNRPISYGSTFGLLSRFENAMIEPWSHPQWGEFRWLDECGMYALAYWWSDQMVQASIPPEWKQRITAIAIDGTCKHQWSIPSEFSTNEAIYAKHAEKRSKELGLEEPDLTDDENPCGTKPGELGPDGRPIRSKSPSARWGYRTQTKKDKSKYFFGHDVVLGVAVHHFEYQGDPERWQPDREEWESDPDNWRPGDDVPQIVTSVRVVPAGTDPSPTSARVTESTLRCMPHIKDVIADRIITNKPDFCQQMQSLGLNVVMDYTKTEIANPKNVKFGRNGNDYYVHTGGIYPGWAGKSVVEPPAIRRHKTADNPKVTDEELAHWYSERARTYQCSLNQRLPANKNLRAGGFQYMTPLAAGRIGTAATMHTANDSATEHPADVVYPEKFINVPAEDAVRLQARPWGTPAWKADYGRRAIVETGNSQLKDEAGFAAEKCRIFKFVAEIIHTTLVVVIHNLEEIRRYELNQQELRDKKARNQAAKNNGHGKLNGSAEESVTIATASGAEAAEATTHPQSNGQTPSSNGAGDGEQAIEVSARSADTEEDTTSAQTNGHAADPPRSGPAAAAKPTNSHNRRKRNKRRREPQQRRQAPPNGRSPPGD